TGKAGTGEAPFLHWASVEEALSSGPASDHASAAFLRSTAAGTNLASSASIASRSTFFSGTVVSLIIWAGPSSFVGLPLPGVLFGIVAIRPPAIPATASRPPTQAARRRLRG